MITKRQQEIHDYVEKEKLKLSNDKWKKIGKEVLKKFGGVPIFVLSLFSAIGLSFIVALYSIFILPSQPLYLFLGEYTIMIMYGFMQTILGLFIFIIEILFIDMYHKSESLCDSDRK